MHIALYKPDIPQNTAAIIRLGACLNLKIHIIEPCGFNLHDSRFKRVVMDYMGMSRVFRYEDYDEFLKKNKDKRISSIDIGELIDDGKNSENSIIVKKDLHRQKILGFGGAFTEASASIYHKLDKAKKNEIIQAYFGKRGNAYNMARTHINTVSYTHLTLPTTEYEMKRCLVGSEMCIRDRS